METSHNPIMPQNKALDFVIADFKNSGISENIAHEYINKCFITADENGYFIYYPELYTNSKTSYYNKKLMNSTKSKYIKPKDESSRLFRPLHLNPECLSNPEEYIIITEGEKKAIKAVQEGFNCVALSGVWAWKKNPQKNSDDDKDKKTVAIEEDFLTTDIIPDIANANFKEKVVYLCYDNDLWQNEQVKNALYQFSAYLISEKKAIVKIIDLPKMEDE